MAEYRFSLLGSPRIEHNDQPIPITRHKQWGLLTYLLLTRQVHERDALAALFWPAYNERSARADLRRELARLRSTLPELLLCEHGEVALRPDASLWVDVWAIEQHLAAVKAHNHPAGLYCAACCDHLHAACDLYAGDLLAGFTIADTAGFEDWLFFQQESLRIQHIDLLDQLAGMEMAAGNLAQAIPPLRQRLALDPLHEESHRQLIWLYIHTGQRQAALRQFGECKEALARELGIAPSPATVSLYEQIGALSATRSPAWADADQALRRSTHDWLSLDAAAPRFIGRERQLAQLAAHLDAACAGRGRVAFVSGEAGAGKTALLNEFARLAATNRSDLIVACGCGTTPYAVDAPLLPFRDLFAMLTGDFQCEWAEFRPSEEQLLRLRAFFPSVLHALVTAGPHLVGSLVAADGLLARANASYLAETEDYARLGALVAAQRQGAACEPQQYLFAEVEAVLRALAGERPLLLLIDNLHWADTLSLNLLFHLGKRLGAQPLLIAGAYRPDEIADDDSARAHDRGPPAHHPLGALIHELVRDFGPVQVDLDATTPAEACAWLDGLLAAENCRPSAPLRDALFTQTHGLPLYATELLQTWREQGRLCRTADGFWIEHELPSPVSVPPKSAAAIQRRLDHLSDEGLSLLLVACVQAEPFTVHTLGSVQGWSERRTLELIAAELHHRHHLLVEDSRDDPALPPSYRFANPLVRTYLLSQLDNCERRLLSGTDAALGTQSGMQSATQSGTQLGTPAGRARVIVMSGMVDGQDALLRSLEPVCPLAAIAHSQRSDSMYHRWHFNYPILLLILAILLVVWAVTYSLTMTTGFRLSDLWQPGAPAERAGAKIEVAPGFYVPKGYYTQEKTARALPATQSVAVSPGFKVPLDYFTQEKTARLAPVTQFVEVSPGFQVPLDYYTQEKTARVAPVTQFVEVSPGFKVPLDYYIQEKMTHAVPATKFIEISPGFQVPLDYFIQEKTGS